MKRKKFALLLGTMVVAGLLTACGGKSGSEVAPDTSITEDVEDNTKETVADDKNKDDAEEVIEIIENYRLDSLEKTYVSSIGEIKDKLPASIDDFMNFYVANDDYEDATLVSDRISGDETIGYHRTWGLNAYPTKDEALRTNTHNNVLLEIYNGTDEEYLPVSDCYDLGDIRLTSWGVYGLDESNDIADVKASSLSYFICGDKSVFEGTTPSEADSIIYQQYVDTFGPINYLVTDTIGTAYKIGWVGDDYAILMDIWEDTNVSFRIYQINIYSRNLFDAKGLKTISE